MHLRVSILLSGILTLAMLVSGATAVNNIITNPDFEDGTNGWSIDAQGVLSIDEKEESPTGHPVMMAKINAVGPNSWNPELHSPSFDVEIAKQYTVDFWAKTEPEATRAIDVRFEQLETWKGHSRTITLAGEWQLLSFSPIMDIDSPPAVVIHIQFNHQLGDVWFSHFRVYEGEFVKEDLAPVTPVGRQATAWGRIKNR